MPRPFVPKPGQTDYTKARWAPVVNCIVKYGERILIVRRSKEMNLYPGLWNSIGGYLDDEKSLEGKVREEIREETGIGDNGIVSIQVGKIFDLEDLAYGKTFVVHPVLVEVNTDRVVLDWEAEEFRWVTPQEATAEPDLVPGFPKVLAAFF